jgi:2-octaprenyl-6-methoxyphenol hydroxylase
VISSGDEFDLVIAGGGMVGASLAVALGGLGVRAALIEAVPFGSAAQPSFDERTTALSNGSRRILETLGVWPDVAPAATPIARIHVSDRGQFGFARIDAREQGLAALGYVVPNRALGAALWSRLQNGRELSVLSPAEITAVEPGERTVRLTARCQDSSISLSARLVIAADGAESFVRGAFGVSAEVRDYGQTALITTILPREFHQHVAYERFTSEGPMALLPLADGRMTLVLTLSHAMAAAALEWSEEQFLAELQRRFGFRLGRFLKVGRRVAYPLSLTRSRRTSAGRCIIVGNAAQGLHPVAGMGFNLGLRDVATLAELVALHRDDLEELSSAYDEWRSGDRNEIIGFTDGLVRLFSNPLAPVRGLRNLGLLAFDLLPPAKAALSSLSVGGSGRIPKLARGVPLR